MHWLLITNINFLEKNFGNTQSFTQKNKKMLALKDLIYLYRLRPWGEKLSSFRMLGYTIFGYLMVGVINIPIILINTLAVIGVLLSGFLLNDYYDFKIQKENNFLAAKFKDGFLNDKNFFVYLIAPLFLIVPIFLIGRFVEINNIFLFSVFAGLFLIIFYSVPSIRLKERKILGFLTTPLAVSFLFLQAYTIFKAPDLNIILLVVIIFLFQCYLETLHIIKDSKDSAEKMKINLKDVFKFLKIFPLISFFASVLFLFFNPFFIVTAIFSLIRLNEANNIKIKNVQKIRANPFSLVLSLYEFGIYGILGALHLF
jgi:hypothetical protein